MHQNNYRWILEYMLNKSVRLENDFKQLKHNEARRQCDELDYLEFIIAYNRIAFFDEIFREMYQTIKMSHGTSR